MLRRICRECGAEMIRKYSPGGSEIFCEDCDSSTAYDESEMDPYCPECGEKIEVCTKCCVGYFCKKCNSLKSSKKVVWKKV